MILIISADIASEDASLNADLGSPDREITSENNSTFKVLRSLLSGPGITREGQALIAGVRPVGEILGQFPERAVAWVSTADEPPPRAGLPWLRLKKALFREIDFAGTKRPMLLVTAPALPRWSNDLAWPEGCTLFIPFQNPDNVGALIRSAAAFGVARVVLTEGSANPFHPKASRAAGTALFQLPLFTGPSLAALQELAKPLVTLSMEGRPLSDVLFPPSFALLPGAEGPGLPETLRGTTCVAIPMQAGVESLNAAMATTIVLYAHDTARRAAGGS